MEFRIWHDPYTPNIHHERVARIYLPRGAHEQNLNAFETLESLRRRLLELDGIDDLEVEWAPCKQNDRAQSCSYVIQPQQRDPRLDLDLTANGDMANKRYRLEILNRAIDQVGIPRSSHIWLEHGSSGMSLLNSACGNVQVASPGHVARLLARMSEGCLNVIHGGSAYEVHFHPIEYHIKPTSYATIAAELRNSDFSETEAKEQLREMSTEINSLWMNNDADVRDVRIEGSWIVADVATPMGAEAICEYPLDFGRVDTYFRQVYFINGNPYNFKSGGLSKYRLAREEDRSRRFEDQGNYAPSDRFGEFVVDHFRLRGVNGSADSLARERLQDLTKRERKLLTILRAMTRKANFVPDERFFSVSNELKEVQVQVKQSKAASSEEQDQESQDKGEVKNNAQSGTLPAFSVSSKRGTDAVNETSDQLRFPSNTAKRPRPSRPTALVPEEETPAAKLEADLHDLEAKRAAFQKSLDKLQGVTGQGIARASLMTMINRKTTQIGDLRQRLLASVQVQPPSPPQTAVSNPDISVDGASTSVVHEQEGAAPT